MSDHVNIYQQYGCYSRVHKNESKIFSSKEIVNYLMIRFVDFITTILLFMPSLFELASSKGGLPN